MKTILFASLALFSSPIFAADQECRKTTFPGWFQVCGGLEGTPTDAFALVNPFIYTDGNVALMKDVSSLRDLACATFGGRFEKSTISTASVSYLYATDFWKAANQMSLLTGHVGVQSYISKIECSISH